MHRSKKIFILSLVLTLFSSNSFAQDAGASSEDILKESLADLTLVAYAGLGGAVLGLSTLSFADEPGEHLDNIVVGGAIGIIIGVGYVAYRQAVASSTEYENQSDAFNSVDFNTRDRQRWAALSHHKYIPPSRAQVGWNFSF